MGTVVDRMKNRTPEISIQVTEQAPIVVWLQCLLSIQTRQRLLRVSNCVSQNGRIASR
jgi:hypothetical protein